MEKVRERIADGRLLDLMRSWLKQDIMSGMESWTPTEGSLQGAVIRPLLANIYLHPLDELMAGHRYKMVRYADDFVVLRQSREEAEAALALIRAWVAENGLHPDKTHIGNFRKKGGGFSFLGYSFEGKRRHVRKKSLDKLKDKTRQKTKRTCSKNLKQVIVSLNPVLRGWFEYFKHAHRPVFKRLDGLVRRRFSCASKKASRGRTLPGRSNALDQRLLRGRRAVRASHGLAEREMPPMRKPHARLCVQRRLACSAGDKPAGVKVRSPVVWIAAWRETKTLKPIDKVSFGEITSRRAVTKVNANVASKVSGTKGRARNRRGEGSMGR